MLAQAFHESSEAGRRLEPSGSGGGGGRPPS